jgi:hypothetical protein
MLPHASLQDATAGSFTTNATGHNKGDYPSPSCPTPVSKGSLRCVGLEVRTQEGIFVFYVVWRVPPPCRVDLRFRPSIDLGDWPLDSSPKLRNSSRWGQDLSRPTSVPLDFDTRRRDEPFSAIVQPDFDGRNPPPTPSHLEFNGMRGGPPPISTLISTPGGECWNLGIR